MTSRDARPAPHQAGSAPQLPLATTDPLATSHAATDRLATHPPANGPTGNGPTGHGPTGHGPTGHGPTGPGRTGRYDCRGAAGHVNGAAGLPSQPDVHSLPELRRQLRSAPTQHDEILIDLSGIARLGRPGLAALVLANRAARARHQRLTVQHPTPAVLAELTAAHADLVLQILPAEHHPPTAWRT